MGAVKINLSQAFAPGVASRRG